VPTQWFYSQDGRMMLGPCTSGEMKAEGPGQNGDGPKREGIVRSGARIRGADPDIRVAICRLTGQYPASQIQSYT
jgi:hypothetical protein